MLCGLKSQLLGEQQNAWPLPVVFYPIGLGLGVRKFAYHDAEMEKEAIPFLVIIQGYSWFPDNKKINKRKV